LVAVVALGLLATIPASSSADELVTFDATAGADGLRIELTTPGFLVSNVFDGGAPVAQATANGTGQSRGFAAMPYPGDTPITLPGLLLPILGLPSLPDYPLIATSNNPVTPEAAVEAGAFTARSRSDDRGSVASVTGGVDAGGNKVARIVAEARAEANPSTGEVVASAHTTVEGTSVLGLLTIGRVDSSARVKRSVSGEGDVVESTFEIEPIRVGDLRIAITPSGLELLGAGGIALPFDSIEPLLQSAGITMRFLEATPIEGGVISAGLSISMPSPIPEPLNGTITITYGRVRAVASATGGGADLDLGSGAIDVPSDLGASTDLGSLGGTVIDAPLGAPTSPATAQLPDRLRPVASTESAASVYVALVLGAVVAVVGAVLFRALALKVVWT
jgi:hypothetical protein